MNGKDPLAGLTIVRKQRWFVWRDIVTLLLAIAVVLLVRQVGDLKDQLVNASDMRAQQFAELNAQLDDLQTRLTAAQQQTAAAQALAAEQADRIRQLTDALVAAGQPVPPVRATAQSAPTPAPRPSGPRPTPQPSPTATATPSPTTTPTPSPSPTPGLLCRLHLTC